MFASVLRMHLQTSFEELGVPLSEVTFCVVDLETTGGSPHESAITEIGAVKIKFGEQVGTFHTLVDPGRPVPAFIRLLTGITDSELMGAPKVHAALPSFLEFAKGSVLVAHNARFDVGFLNHALAAHGYPKLEHKVIDTAILARKILAGETPNNKLETLARYLRCAHLPNHRAFQDVLATVDVLHQLIERVSGYGVTTLEDLLAISRTKMDGSFKKLRLTEDLPQSTGVYRFIGHRGKVLYIGKATDIRARVRSYFYGDPRRKIRDLLRETEAISFETHATLLEAEVAEARAIAKTLPPYNRTGKKASKWYLKIDVRAKTPRAHTSRTVKPDGGIYLGPLPSSKTATLFLEALRDAGPLHRCAHPSRCKGCAFSEMSKCTGTDPSAHRTEVRRAARALAGEHELVLEPLATKMLRLAAAERYEEAADLRERSERLERSLYRCQAARGLVEAGDVVFAVGERLLLVRSGRLAAATHGAPTDDLIAKLRSAARGTSAPTGHLTADTQREAKVILDFLARRPSEVRIIYSQRPWVMPIGAKPTGMFAVKRGRCPERE